METTYRPAVAEDAGRVREIVELAYTPYVDRIGMRPGPLDDDQAAQVRDGLVHVAEQDGRVVGVLVLEHHPDHVLVDNVAVDPAVRGTGVGRGLLVLAEEQAADVGELRLFTHQQMVENRALYARIGYIETHTADVRAFFTKRL